MLVGGFPLIKCLSFVWEHTEKAVHVQVMSFGLIFSVQKNNLFVQLLYVHFF